MTNAELLNTNSRDQKKIKKQTKRTNAIEISENTQEKNRILTKSVRQLRKNAKR